MKSHLRKILQLPLLREPAFIAVCALLALALYAWFAQSAGRARAQLTANVTALQEQASRLELQATEVARLRAAPASTASRTDLRTLLQTQANAAGLAPALLRIDVADADQVQVTFGAVAFADWLAWAASLQAQRVRVDSCRIEALTAPGMVSVTATLARPAQQ